ncbi:ABC transporter permease [Bacillus sp. FJAT-49731]|uniref:ABC transporter permease n=2 Tax=Lederbergia citrea TaxID=2833581 RepID=A0A942UNL7_9BACI|nr:ABC transporter permease [Lederbergia citrea]MBS4203310.1 ABC transporter permease [Lederbergia citrea]MBS4222018.1 ABC transporter permease [Lederbergia citrea]
MTAMFFWGGLFAIILVSTVFAPLFSTHNPNEIDLTAVYASPGKEHWLGTDNLGRDVYSRILYGGRVTLAVAALAGSLSLLFGIIYGGISGYFGKWIDSVMMRFLEAMNAIPSLIIILAFQAVLHGGIISMALLIGLTNWLVTARIIRSQFLNLKSKEFVTMAKMFGTPIWKIITVHLLRNSIPAIFVVTLFNFAGAIFIEVSLSFLGIGVPPSVPSWGNMLYHAQNDILIGAWWIALFPGIMIFISILSINFLGEYFK